MALRVFCSELTKEINVLENKKYDETIDATHILNFEKKTSQRYLFLAKILQNYRQLEQECILTAFSMNPTQECFELVCKLAESNEKVTDGENSSQPDTSHSESIDALHTITSVDLLLNSKDYDVLRAPNRLLDSLTMLSEGVRSDLVCLLTMPRIKNLNWCVPWPQLKIECQALLDVEKKRQIVENTTANANEKLKFINLNYADFKDFKPHEYPGIEKGYEIYVADSDSEESLINYNGAVGNESEDTDSAPESKNFIIKEARRLQNKRRRLIKRSKQLLEEIETDAKIKKEPNASDPKKKRKLRVNSDCLKPAPKSRRGPLKKHKLSVENGGIGAVNVKIESNVDIKIEPDAEVKVEPIENINNEYDIDATQFSDQDVSRTFSDLSNLSNLNGTNFVLGNNFYPAPPNTNTCNLTENVSEAEFQRNNDLNPEQLDDLANFNYLPIDTSNQCSQSTLESTTINNPDLVNSLKFDHSKNEIDGQTFHSIYDRNFEDDHKFGLQLQNIVGILSIRPDISYLANETINMQTELDTDEPPVLTELCPLKQTINGDNSCTNNQQMNSDSKLCEMPFASNNTIPATNLQKPKPKNPLLTFRRPKKCINKSNESAAFNTSNGLSTDTMAIDSPVKIPAKPFSFENKTDDWMTTTQMSSQQQNVEQNNDSNLSMLQRQQSDLFSCNITTDLSNGQVCTIRFFLTIFFFELYILFFGEFGTF